MVSSQSLYRKWRSQTFAEVVGQEHITRTLLNALRTHRVAHAYLFCGPRGTGKTSTARLLAKAINCRTNGGEGEPCNECDLCRAITEGRCLDIVEIDAASNRGIDEIRDLRDKVNFTPSEAQRKFYIIDEVHQLTSDAFNALLKTLEEPPAHTIFVLASTEAHKIPATILSRCQRFEFRRIPLDEMVSRLRYICEQEDIAVETAALEMVARAATGSLRDAESLLDQLRAYAEGEITAAQVESLLGAGGIEAVRELVASLFRKDLAGGLRLINRLADEGTDMHQLGREAVDYLRQLLLLKAGAAGRGVDAGEETVEAMAATTTSLALGDIMRALRLFSQVDFAARGLVQPQLPLEMAYTEYVLAGEEPAPASAPVRPAPAVSKVAAAVSRMAHEPAAAKRRTIAPPPRPAPVVEVAEQEPPAEAPSGERIMESAPAQAEGTGADLDVETLRGLWGQVLDALGRTDRKVQALLRDCTGPVRVDDRTVFLAFVHGFHKEQIEQAKNRATVEDAISQLVGQRYLVRCELNKRQERKQSPSALEDPLVREAVSQGARIKGVKNTSPTEVADDSE